MHKFGAISTTAAARSHSAMDAATPGARGTWRMSPFPMIALMALTALALVTVGTGCGGMSAAPGSAATSSARTTATVDYDSDRGSDRVLQLAGLTKTAGEEPSPSVYFHDQAYNPSIATPEAVLGHPLGAFPASPQAIVDCFHRWAGESDRVQVKRYATTYEGRELVRAVISTPENLARLDRILADIGRLADPRGLSAAQANTIIANTPAIGWFGYSIHGNEVSGSDAAVAFGYHLAAADEASVKPLLDQVIVVIDPVMNPDGRERAIQSAVQMNSRIPSDDFTGRHLGHWPFGRGNHYLFDLNRDWLVGAHPETRGRWREILSFHPQLFVDAHEMGGLDTYLFSPKNQPYNPSFPSGLHKWQQTFARDQAAAFDQRGWAYYTREWSDGWFPGYSSTWGPIIGAVGILYEQASTRGFAIKRPSGVRLTYRDSVRGHALSSIVNLATLASNREAILRDYLTMRRSAVAGTGRAFAILPTSAPDRAQHLLQILLRQNIEVHRTTRELRGRNIRTALGQEMNALSLPAGSYIVYDDQPESGLLHALLDFDPRMDEASLRREREKLELEGSTRIYDITAWNLGHAFALDALWMAAPPRAQTEAVTKLPPLATSAEGANDTSANANASPNASPSTSNDAYAWIVDGRADAAPIFAAQAMELGLTVHAANAAFTAAEGTFTRGSIVVRRDENPANTADLVAQAAKLADAVLVPLASGFASRPETPPVLVENFDLGGRNFRALERPRIALLANSPIRNNIFGHLWYHIDQRLKLPITMIDLQHLNRTDLRRYNVLILPDVSNSIDGLLMRERDTLAAWLRQGGTLIAMGQSAGAIAKESLKLSRVRLRRDVLDALPLYQADAGRSVASRTVELDSAAIWDGIDPPASPTAPADANGAGRSTGAGGTGGASGSAAAAGKGGKGPGNQIAAQRDAWERRFSPRGVILRALVDERLWLTSGVNDNEMPVLFGGDRAFVATQPVRVALRLDAGPRLRLSGLLWPEARRRLGHSAYLTAESVGHGQIILFAFDPVFRAITQGTGRLFANAVIYGPGLGARPALPR